MSTGRCFQRYVLIHGCKYGEFKVIPIRGKWSCVGICIKVVSAKVDDVTCDCVYVSSGKKKNWSASLFFVWMV